MRLFKKTVAFWASKLIFGVCAKSSPKVPIVGFKSSTAMKRMFGVELEA